MLLHIYHVYLHRIIKMYLNDMQNVLKKTTFVISLTRIQNVLVTTLSDLNIHFPIWLWTSNVEKCKISLSHNFRVGQTRAQHDKNKYVTGAA